MLPEAMRVALDAAFTTYPIQRIQTWVNPLNSSAIRAYERVGFKVEGRIRSMAYSNGTWVDSLLLSLIHSEWISLRRPASGNE